MNNPEKEISKIRFRLPNGEEFEAEGSREFIESQRNHFLALIGKGNTALQPITRAMAESATSVSAAALNESLRAPQHTELYYWERIFKEDGKTLTLRKKNKLTPQELVFLILAGAKVLFNQPSYSALELAHSLKSCGVGEGKRLDRLLAAELQGGRILAQGSKRSRTYQLTDSGFAKAFVLAEKLLQTA